MADLATYPHWLSIVLAVEAQPDGAWLVDLGARVGPVKRAKRVRMVCTEHVRPSRVRFEREELDGKEHSPWVLTAAVHDGVVDMHLFYGGGAWLPGVGLVLQQEVNRAPGRLNRFVCG